MSPDELAQRVRELPLGGEVEYDGVVYRVVRLSVARRRDCCGIARCPMLGLVIDEGGRDVCDRYGHPCEINTPCADNVLASSAAVAVLAIKGMLA